MSHELVEKYEALIPVLETRRADLRRARRGMFWLLVVGAVTAPPAWFAGVLPFVVDVTLWVTLWATGYYIATMYDWGYERQIVDARAELAGLRAGVARAEAGAEAAPLVDGWAARRIPRQAVWSPARR